MKNNALIIYYNSSEVTTAQGLCHLESGYHVAQSQLDADLLTVLEAQLPDDCALIVTDAAAVHPPFWKERMAHANHLPAYVQVCSALSCEYFELSPLIDQQSFEGGVKALDQCLYLSQKPSYYPTSQLNHACFWLRNKSALTEVMDSESSKHAVNHCLVQKAADCLILTECRDIGDQRPLPAHPLATFHANTTNRKNFIASNAYPHLDGKPVVLHINMDWGGGVHKWIDDYIAYHPQYHHLVLNSCGELYRHQHGEQYRLLWQGSSGYEVSRFQMNKPIKATTINNEEYQAILEQIIQTWDVQGLVVSTLIGHAMDCLNTGLPTLRLMHDYFPHWPVLNAQLDADVIDETVVKRALAATVNEPFGQIEQSQWAAWQRAENQAIKQKHVTLVAPSQSVKTNVLKLNAADGFEKIQILPHGINPIPAIDYQAESAVFTVLVLGRINPPKGQAILDDCLAHLKEHKDIRFTFLGAGNEGKKYLPNPQVNVVMDYQEGELAELLAEAKPQLALITSLASETFNYTLSELQSAAIPVLSTRHGALAARITDKETGFLAASEATDFVNQILALKNDRQALQAVHEQLKQLKPLSTESAMQAYQSVFTLESKPNGQVEWQLNQPQRWAQQILAQQSDLNRLKQTCSDIEQESNEKTKWAEDLSQQVNHLEHNLDLSKKQEAELLATIDSQKDAMQATEVQHRAERQATEEQHGAERQRLQKIIQEKDEVLIETIASLGSKAEALAKMEQHRNHINQQLQSVYQSRSWRVTRPMRRFTTWARHKRNAVKFRAKQIKSWPKRGINSLKTRGLAATIKIILGKFKKPAPPEAPVSVSQVTQDFQKLTLKLPAEPKVSVIVPVYNHFEHTYHCLKSLKNLADLTPFEVIVVDDCSTDKTEKLIKNISGIRYQRQQVNGGFIESCNTGAKMAKGEFLLFLNNDTEVHEGGIDALVNTFDDKPDAGLVGSQLIYPDGRLQESGGIVFSDASGWNYGRLDEVNKPCYQHLREVSYCSGASILIKKSLFEQLGRFDERYKPAYYEDTDLAFAVRKAGLKVYVQPASQVTHFEGISSGTDLSSGTKKYQVINQEKFLDKWQSELKNQPASGSDIELARFQNQPKRVLIFDACTPTPDQDSGSLRMMNLMKIFQELGYQVSFIPENMAHFEQYTSSLQQIGVECVYAPAFSSPVEYLSQIGKYFDVVLLSRYYVAAPVMDMIRDYCPKAQLLFDTVDLHYLREQRMAEVAEDKKQLAAAQDTKGKELAVAKACDTTLVVSPYEQSVLAEETPELDVQILSNIHEVYGCLKPYAERKDLVFIGGYQHTPNVDGILWFVEAIWPAIKQAIPEIQLHIVGSKAPKEVEALGELEGIVFHGFVEDIEPVMSDYRIAVAPLRFGAGVKGKVNMSMSYGQPVVGTAVAVEGMYTTHGEDVMMSDDEQLFAQHVIELYQDEALWNQISQGGLKNVEQWFSFNAAKKQIKTILKD